MKIFAGRIRDVNKGYWISFENHPRLLETKQSIYIRCVPCLEKLYAQLQSSSTELKLEEPLDCWKIVVVLNSFDQCLALLELYQDENFPLAETVRGRIGTKDRDSSKVVVVFQLHEEQQRDRMIADLKQMAGKIAADFDLYLERGCSDIYGTLCGDWRNWGDNTPIVNLSAVDLVKEKVAKLIRGEF